MKNPRRNGRTARLIAAVAVVLAASLTFVLLGGVTLGHSAIGADQYGPVRHISILNASVGANGAVTLRVRIIGWKMYPALVGKSLNLTDGGHWAIFVGGRFNAASANATKGKSKPLKRGRYTLYAQLVNNDGSYLTPAVRSGTVRVRITRTTRISATTPPEL
jgi:hypothetical protein